MANKIFLDTNIVADIIDKTRSEHKKTLDFLEYLILEDYTICISEDMLTTLFYILKEKRNTLKFFENLIFVDWSVLTFGLDTIKSATSLSLEHDLDLEDVLQCLCAKENGCDVLITNDKNFYDCGIKIMIIKEFLA
jgi:predicted nucleic acid-binding protein